MSTGCCRLALTVLAVEALYFLAPNVKQRFLATLPGALLSVGCWIGLSYLLGLYFRTFANFNKTYRTLGEGRSDGLAVLDRIRDAGRGRTECPSWRSEPRKGAIEQKGIHPDQ